MANRITLNLKTYGGNIARQGTRPTSSSNYGLPRIVGQRLSINHRDSQSEWDDTDEFGIHSK